MQGAETSVKLVLRMDRRGLVGDLDEELGESTEYEKKSCCMRDKRRRTARIRRKKMR